MIMKSLIFGFLLFPAFFAPSGLTNKPECVEVIKPDCYCILIYDPVCGCNGVTYGNACQAECASITKYKRGECKDKKNPK